MLRLLGPEEAAACAAREARDPDFAALVAAWRADLEPLDAAYAEAAPPAGLERRITDAALRRRALGPRPALAQRRALAGGRRGGGAGGGLVRPCRPRRRRSPGEAPARLVSALASGDSDVALLAVFEPQAAVLNINRTSRRARRRAGRSSSG